MLNRRRQRKLFRMIDLEIVGVQIGLNACLEAVPRPSDPPCLHCTLQAQKREPDTIKPPQAYRGF
jgi:hypothetical protein